MKKQFAVLSVLIIFCIVYPGIRPEYQWPPAEASVNRVLDVLRDAKLKSPAAKEIKKEKLRIIYKDMLMKLNFPSALWRATGTSSVPPSAWNLVKLFEQILEKIIYRQNSGLLERKSRFYKESMLSDNQAEIQTKIITSSKEIPIFYRMILKDSKWKVYDVVVENVEPGSELSHPVQWYTGKEYAWTIGWRSCEKRVMAQ